MPKDTPLASPSNPLAEPETPSLSGDSGLDPALVDFLNEVKENWPEIELQLENVSQWDEDLKKKLSAYIDDLKSEVKAITAIRWLSVLAAGVSVCLLFWILLHFLLDDPRFFIRNQYSGAALIVATISAIVLILRAALTGAFTSIQDRNKGEMSAKSLVEAADHAKSLSEQFY